MFSGISNYRPDQHNPPLREKSRTPSDIKAVARIHYDEMAAFLKNYLAKEPANTRPSAREKLTRLTRLQFRELSTDVYDELLRRKNNANNEVPSLLARDDFHPRRNEARQKLATLPKARFKDLSGDVFFELGRRYPEFRKPEVLQDPTSPTSDYDDLDIPPSDFPQSSENTPISRITPVDSGFTNGNRQASENSYRRPSVGGFRRRPAEDAYGGGRSEEAVYNSMRRPSEDGYGKAFQIIMSILWNADRQCPSPNESGEDDRDLTRSPSGTVSMASDSTNATNTTTNTQKETIIPSRNAISEEEIEVPSTRERENSNAAVGEHGPRSSDPRDRSPELVPVASGSETRKEEVGMKGLRRTFTSLGVFDLTERVHCRVDGHYLTGGAYGDIRIGDCIVPGRGKVKVAVKCVRLYLHDNPEVMKLIDREVRLWSKLEHPNILPLLGFAIEQHGLLALISEFMDNGTVLKYVQTHPDCDIIPMVLGLAEGISYLHDSKIIHSDIKSDNVLVSQSGEPLICDFGVSRLIAISQTMVGHGVQPQSGTIRGTARWMSPELLLASEDHAAHSKESDVWAFGMTVYELLAKKRPYHHLGNEAQVITSIIRGNLPQKPRISESWPESHHRLWDKCRECWSSEPQARVLVIGNKSGHDYGLQRWWRSRSAVNPHAIPSPICEDT